MATNMDAHIQELLDELGAHWLNHGDLWVATDGTKSACAGIVRDEFGITDAFISLPTDEYPTARVAYFVALHEIGHLIQLRGTRKTWVKRAWPRTLLDREAHAWQYALREARYKPSRAVWQHIYDGMSTYILGTNRRHKYSAQFAHLFAKVCEELS